MNLSHAYGVPPPPEVAARVLLRARELGVTHFDSAALYGFGANQELVGRTLAPLRSEFTLASKCGQQGVSLDGGMRRVLDGRPATLKQTCEDSLRRLRTDAIDLSDVSAGTLRRAHVVHPIAAVQSEYSLWSREPEIAVLDCCREIGATFVAFSPLARAWVWSRGEHVAANLVTPALRTWKKTSKPRLH